MKVLGIDPGKKGALVFLEKDYDTGKVNHISTYPMPLKGKGKSGELEIRRLWQIIDLEDPDLIILEKVHAMPKQGTVSMFSFGKIYGETKAVCELTHRIFGIVRPSKWKNDVLGQKYEKGDKNVTIKYCQMNFPQVSLLRTTRSYVNDNNIADALCIAMYGIKNPILLDVRMGDKY